MENCQKRTEKRQLTDEQHSLQQKGSEAHSNLDECRKSENTCGSYFLRSKQPKIANREKEKNKLETKVTEYHQLQNEKHQLEAKNHQLEIEKKEFETANHQLEKVNHQLMLEKQELETQKVKLEVFKYDDTVTSLSKAIMCLKLSNSSFIVWSVADLEIFKGGFT